MIWNIALFVFALAVVIKSAGWFLNVAEKIGVYLHLPPFILGVVLVGFGTSLPEFATSLAAVSKGVETVTIANITGSNIANILLIIGLSTIALGTIKFDKNLIDLDIPLLIGVTALFSILIVDGNLSRGDGIILLVGFLGYIIYALSYREDKEHHKGLISLIASLSKSSEQKIEQKHQQKTIGLSAVAVLLVSIALLGASSVITVDSLLRIVKSLNIGVDVLSFLALAIGTSLPELVVSFKALRKGQGDIVVGNVIGSSMFNLLLVGGTASVIHTQIINPKLVVWVITGLAISILLLMVGSISKRIHIWEGFIYVLLYFAIAIKII